jgi:hypothetical protein
MMTLRPVAKVVAPAGSTLVFHESVMHASGAITSGRDRLLVISGWSRARSRCRFVPPLIHIIPNPRAH